MSELRNWDLPETCGIRESWPHPRRPSRLSLFVLPILLLGLGSGVDRARGLTIEFKDETGALIDKQKPGKLTAEQVGALMKAADLWIGGPGFGGAKGLYDPITVTIVVGFGDFEKEQTLAAARTKRVRHDYKTVRAAMAADAQGFIEQYTVSKLPFAGGKGQVGTQLRLSSANARALGLGDGPDTWYGIAPPFGADGSVVFSNSFQPIFAYDRPVEGWQCDFISIAAHEIGHVLGFLSWIDEVKVNQVDYTNILQHTLDIWRFKETAGPHDLTAEARQTKVGPAEYYDSQLKNKSMSHGDVLDSPCASTYQASHWRCYMKDIMRPAFDNGETVDPTWDDVHALDYIGYDTKAPKINFPLEELACKWFECPIIWPPRPGPCPYCPNFEGIFDQLPDPPFPEDLNPPFEPDIAVRIGLSFDIEGMHNRSGLGFARFHVEMPNPNRETIEPSPGIGWENLRPGPIEPVQVLPPAITEFYFESDTTGGMPFTFTDTLSNSGAWLDADLGEYGGYRITGFLDGRGDGVIGDVDAVVAFDLLADMMLVPDATAQNVFVASRSTGNLIRIIDPVALGIPLADFDCNRNGIPDNQEVDTDGDGIIDDCEGGEVESVAAFAFGSRMLTCPTFNDPTVTYTMVYHGTPADLAYDPNRGWGYEVVYPVDSPYGNRNGYGVFGPFDDSPNNRNKFPDACPEELYDSFIGAKNFTDECSTATIGDPCMPCASILVPEGIIFRVDVPNGLYRFVAAAGDADNLHAHRILAEDGGSGPPAGIGPNHVVLVSNFDQAQQVIGEADPDRPGEGVFARVGFGDKIPPPGDGESPSPQFVNMDARGLATDGFPDSPVLEVTQGYIRIHQLQGNANDGPGGPRDGNGGDLVILELWRMAPEGTAP